MSSNCNRLAVPLAGAVALPQCPAGIHKLALGKAARHVPRFNPHTSLCPSTTSADNCFISNGSSSWDCYWNMCVACHAYSRGDLTHEVVLLILFLGLAFSYMRRRRIQRENMMYTNQLPPQGAYYPPPPGPPGFGSPAPSGYPNYYAGQEPQYPPPAHSNGYDIGAPYAPPSGPPPQHAAQEPPAYNVGWAGARSQTGSQKV
ncbi:hypothetical protein K488DRAFT_68874 [Vararia minispora EC-137]|uniref:Uncharacterized protein n=1 Tax=Vararia minispora EC-137 TaxID=1314806 RepID=A0ACB8QTI2_9AGAM|nr:hypothetical protein K488DRAFT_68874 [Vararia minispora EC-137]